MSRPILPPLAAAVLLVAACSDAGGPTPALPSTAAPSLHLSVTDETRALEPVARRLAIALGDPGFRAGFRARLAASRYREGKIHLQRTLDESGGAELRRVARLNGEPELTTAAVLNGAEALEVYLPVPAHRDRWQGGQELLVATASRDGDIPVAFDLHGGRHLLDPTRPPDTPVLAVVPVETDFDHGGVGGDATCAPPAPCGGGGGSPPPPPPPPGLYMTAAHFVQDFEGWLKGSPEFEIHVMGQNGSTDSLVKYQCAGEHRTGSYLWDGDTDWSGSVLLFSQTEIDSYKAAHPGEAFRLVAMEDDDTSCQMKIDDNRWATFVGTIGPLYRDITGAIDSGSVKKVVRGATSLRKFLAALAAWIKSNDDLIGNAIEDRIVSEYHTGFNWILKADNNVTNGWLNLQMK